MKTKIYIFALVFCTSLLFGCGHEVVRPHYANLINNNIVIHSKDGKWTFDASKQFNPPVVYEDAKIPVKLLNKNLSLYQNDNYKDSVIDVIVEVNGKEKLYGKMLFSKVFAKAGSNSAKRKWTVGISENYLNIARNGNVAVIYQPYSYHRQDWASWALWISSLPL